MDFGPGKRGQRGPGAAGGQDPEQYCPAQQYAGPPARWPGSCTTGRWRTWLSRRTATSADAGLRRSAPGGSGGQPLSATTEPSVRTRRQGSPMADSRGGAASPQTMAAVLAAFATTQDGAATETRLPTCPGAVTGFRVNDVVQPAAAPSPVCRTDVPELARPPWPGPTTTSALEGDVAQSSAMPMGQPSAGAPATEMSPPRLTSTAAPVTSATRAAARSAARALAVAPRSRTTPAGPRSSRSRGSNSRQRHPGTGRGGVDGRRAAPGPRRSRGRSRGSTSAPPTVGSTAPSVISAAISAAATASASNTLRRTGRPRALAYAGNLRLGPEAATGTVDGAELVAQHLLGQVERLAAGRGDKGLGPERRELASPAARPGVPGAPLHGHLSSPLMW